MGFRIILYANAALYLGSFAIKQGLAVLREKGTTESMLDRIDAQVQALSAGLSGPPEGDDL